MLVVISDLHLTDGTVGETISPGTFSVFARRLNELAEAASWRSDGSYRPIEQIDLVLLGDILDAVRSPRWLARDNVRPWTNPHAPEFLDQVSLVTGDILHRNADSLAALRGLSVGSGASVPAAFRSGKPADGGSRRPIAVRIHYMVGNHDWFYHLPGPSYNALRKRLIEQMGLANHAERPFSHEIGESEELLDAMRRHKVTARHGDVFDPFNFEGDRDQSSIGDVIVVELVSRFAAEVESGLGGELPAATLFGLREISNIRPLMLIPVWIDSLLERTCSFPSMRKRVKTVWDRLADDFLDVSFIRQRDTWSPCDLVDGLERALKFSKRPSIGWTSSIVKWLHEVSGSSSDSYCRHAITEQDFRNRRAKHVVYGHTHRAESVPLEASHAEGFVLNQVYFNSGTWRRVHRQTQLAPGEHEFIASDVMSYQAFFQADERGGRPYETWSGMLGHNPSEITIHRVDPGRATNVTGQAVSTSGLHGHAPHFATSSAEAPEVPGRRI